MIPVMCLVQAGQVSSELEAQLKDDMTQFTSESFGSAAEVVWIEVPEKSGFTAGVPSTSILVSMQSPKKLETSERVPLLQKLCDVWLERTGLSINEVVGVIADPQA
ncbi:hypothetical protein [Kordiimonas sp. SCSIO 12610]|uniref:hypothetical protein n=1 Tax=Kordiimonas sp. SCSIO 12610 TaxID=2829597 RepID=UPI0021094501|nr:hypothetical protein [Kordiimonas sp. SCSIO 12610]UTW56507.1 hypothetical protein KFF44_06290 [Kordiimonas sp. SCSIO 12610]